MSSPSAISEQPAMAKTAAPHGLLTTALAYLPAVLCMMTIGVVVPFIDVLSREFAVHRSALGVSIALFSVPTAILAVLSGGLTDRYGARRALLLAVALAALGSLLASYARSLLALDGALLVAGAGFAGACVTAPALLMRNLTGPTRTRSISFLSTFAPTGYAAGLLLAVPFTARAAWPIALRLHAGLLLACWLLLLWLMPRTAISVSGRESPEKFSYRGLLSVMREPRVVRLAIALALPNGLSYGTSLAIPSYLARVNHLTIATSSAAVAAAKITAMVIGGISMGYLLSRSVSAVLLYSVMVVVGMFAQIVLFLPSSSLPVASGALIVWLFAFGGMAGGAMSLLPAAVSSPARSGAASGVVNQFISLASFAAPPAWLALRSGPQFMGMAAACLLVSLVALPRAAASALSARP